MPDVIEKLQRSTIQHGPLNNRIYLMHLHREDVPDIGAALEDLAVANGYTKILVRTPADTRERFQADGYTREAAIPGYCADGGDLFFVARYLDDGRGREKHPAVVEQNLALVQNLPADNRCFADDELASVAPCRKDDVAEMCRIYRQVYPSYPFPITDPGFLERTMTAHTRYFCIRENSAIVALAGCEIDADNRCVEMTDFAVVPQWRGRRLAERLLARMEQEMADAGMRVAFTISRTLSVGMNVTFKRKGYRFGGKLVNNTHISGGIESMWVWSKRLSPQHRPGKA